MFPKIAGGFQIIGTGHIHGELAAEESEELLFDDRSESVVPIDLIGRSRGQELLLNEGEFGAVHALKGKLIAERQNLSVHEEDVIARRVPDPKVVTPGKQFLFEKVAHKSKRLTSPCGAGRPTVWPWRPESFPS